MMTTRPASAATGQKRAGRQAAASAAKLLIGAASLTATLVGGAWFGAKQMADAGDVAEQTAAMDQPELPVVESLPVVEPLPTLVPLRSVNLPQRVQVSGGAAQPAVQLAMTAPQPVLRRVQAPPPRPVAVTRSSR